ncbi:hypothetical protein OXT66_08705 [Lentilactobacillus senioris]|uniref:hypothetical protein n=1 Tax=Lentilactobacillus senioris TaxID=931534 RepID=UPI002280AFBD|nr:hypothetical protein [Lentilactobacillus senioris]MCY9807597.1 hypothetical protein [Lentilactobacillus senioris]
MATKFNVSVDASFRDKFQIFDENEHLLAKVPTNLASDFFNIFLGWLINIPQTFTFQLNQQSVAVSNHPKFLGASATINVNQQPVAQLSRQRKNVPPFTVELAGQPLTVTTNSGYFAVHDSKRKLIVAKRGSHNFDRYSVVIADEISPAVGLGITIAVLSAIKH